MARWKHWQGHLLDPFIDALLARKADSPELLKHGRRLPAAELGGQQAAEQAEKMGFAVDADWLRRHWRCAALDRQDNLARLLRRSLTADERLEVQGTWPQAPFVALGLHWGTGFPALEHLQISGLKPSFVFMPEDPGRLPSRPARIYNRLHLRALAGFGSGIQVGGAYRAIQDTLAAGGVPVVLIDAPPQPESRLADVRQEAERTVRLRAGVLGLLAQCHVPYVFFRCWKPPRAARRLLEIGTRGRSDDSAEIAAQAAEFLLASLRLDGAQWHLWPHAEKLMEYAAPEAKTVTTTEISA